MADLTPTERAITNLRARRAAGYHLTDNERLLLGEVDRLDADNQELRATAAVDAKQISELEAELATANARLTAVLDACTAADQQYPTTGCPRDPVIHISTIRQAAGQATAVTA